MKNLILRISIIAVILIAGWIAVFRIPDAVESFLPVVETITMTPTEYSETVSGAGIIVRGDAVGGYSTDWFVTIAVGESDIRRVKLGQSASLSGAAFDDGIYTATVFDIAEVAGEHQGHLIRETVVEVTLKIDNPHTVAINGHSGTSGESGGVLRPGYSARADIKTDEPRTIHIIPYSTVMQDDIGEYVFVLSGNSAVRRDILTGIELASGVQVLLGLREYDRIIANPSQVGDNGLVVPAATEATEE
jgi:multidrug efflux pump subunit AcrA (membrane-fusion protein)